MRARPAAAAVGLRAVEAQEAGERVVKRRGHEAGGEDRGAQQDERNRLRVACQRHGRRCRRQGQQQIELPGLNAGAPSSRAESVELAEFIIEAILKIVGRRERRQRGVSVAPAPRPPHGHGAHAPTPTRPIT